jgi:hypothetical protein
LQISFVPFSRTGYRTARFARQTPERKGNRHRGRNR